MNRFKFFAAQYFPLGAMKAASLGLLCSIGFWLSPTAAISQNAVQRDQQALTILKQTIAASGGQQLLASIQDITETGKIAFHAANSDDMDSNVTVKGRGLHQLKLEADQSTGKRTVVVNGYGGSLKGADGRSMPLNHQSAAGLGSITLPYLILIAAVQDTSTKIVYKGLVTHNGASVHDVRFQTVYPKQQDPQGDRGEREARDFYIDPNTLFITAVSDRFHFSRAPHDEGIVHEVLYSNYQPEDGIIVPLTIVETAHGVTSFTMKLSHVTFNSGLGDSEFAW